MKIEPGCMAIIMNSCAGNNGTIITVGNYIGKVNGWKGKHRWCIDKVIKSTHGSTSKHIQEHMLMRIDGFKEDTTQESKEIAHG